MQEVDIDPDVMLFLIAWEGRNIGKELCKNIPSKVADLVKDVRNGRMSLPELQRPFVWRDRLVRELFDSILKRVSYRLY